MHLAENIQSFYTSQVKVATIFSWLVDTINIDASKYIPLPHKYCRYCIYDVHHLDVYVSNYS
jgi:hypothetical protein